jgi:F-box protein 18 (helicase)
MPNNLNFDKLSIEQKEVCKSKAHSIKIKACAGGGKTTLLIAMSETSPKKRCLSLAYNRSIAEEARTKFPQNVVCQSVHGLAFQHVGWAYQEAGKIGESSVTTIAKYLDISTIQAICIRKAVSTFLGSCDPELNTTHLDTSLAKKSGAICDGDLNWLVAHAIKLWDAMCDPMNPTILLPHDGYLKLFIQSAPDLSNSFDTILLDEAQDSSGAVSSFVMRQNCQRILVGDKHQSINSWRGAINAMEKFECDETFSLTLSYRYGMNIADTANSILKWKGESERIYGVGGNNRREGPPAVLCRTNSSVLENSMSLAAEGKAVYLIGGSESYRFKKIIDVCELTFGTKSRMQDPFYSTFSTIEELEEYAVTSNDVETKQICRLVKKYGIKSMRMVKMAQENTVKTVSQASVILGTVHKAKGMEFDVVSLEDDFIDLNTLDSNKYANIEEELNLLYVGFTRAKNILHTSKNISRWLTRNH